MVETLSRHWWAVALRGVAAILFGVLALVWPGITVFALVIVFGAYALVDGAFTLVAAFGDRDGARTRGSRAWLFARGIAGILTGIIAAVWPGITAARPALGYRPLGHGDRRVRDRRRLPTPQGDAA